MSKLSYYQNITPSNSQKQKAKELKEEGFSLRAIAKKLGVGKTTVERWIKEQSTANLPTEKPDLSEDSSEISTKSYKKPDSDLTNTEAPHPPQDTKKDFSIASERVAMRKLELEHERELKRMDFEQKQHKARMQQEQEERNNQALEKLVRPIHQWAIEELNKASDAPTGVPCQVSEILEMHDLLTIFYKKLTTFQDSTANWRALDFIDSLAFLLLTTDKWRSSIKKDYSENLSGEYELTYKWNKSDTKLVKQLTEEV